MDSMEDDDGFTFGEFVFAPPPQLPDPNPSRRGALPLSIFGEVEDQLDDPPHHNHNHNHNPNYEVNYGKSNGNHGAIDLKIESQNGSGLNLNLNSENHDDDDDESGEWEFKGALFGNNNNNIQDQGIKNKAGQDASNTIEHKPEFSSFALEFNDLYVGLPRTVNKLNENDAGFKLPPVISNGFVLDAFPGDEDISKGSGATATNNSSITHEPNSSGSLPRSIDLFAGSLGDGNRSGEIDVGPTSTGGVATNGFKWGAFGGSGNIGNGSGLSDATTISVEHKPSSNSFFPPSDDLFTAPVKAENKSRESDVEFKPTNGASNSFRFDAFPEVEMFGNRSATSATSSSPTEHKADSSNFHFPFDNLFLVPQGSTNKSRETFGDFKKTPLTSNGFVFDPFAEVEPVGNGNGLDFVAAAATTTNEDDDFDDFGDFVDASQEVRRGEQSEQDKQTLSFNAREALPLSFFGDSIEETTEALDHSDGLFHKHTSRPGNGLSGQGSMVPIHDLISNMYSQAQSIQLFGPDEKPAENGAHNSLEKESTLLGGDDEWDEDSWEFKSAFRVSGVKETPSSGIPGNVTLIQLETSQNIQDYIDFYIKLKNALCYLLSCQLDELQIARCPDTGTDFREITETLVNEIQTAHKLLEQGVVSEVISEKHLEKSSCLNEVFKLLEETKFNIIESEFSLSKKLQLADTDWRVTSDLLRHAISILKVLSLGSADEQSHYVSTWCNLVNVCAQELRYGALIWKRASERRVQHQILSESRGRKHVQALGEICKVVELLGLSAKVYEPWTLFSVSESSRFTDLLNECRSLWSNSGLEEALQSLSDDIVIGCGETSIKTIRDFDVLAMHDCVFGEPKSICRLSLLAQEMLPDLKTALWNGEPYFLSLANLWANLINAEPPRLPHVQVNQTG
ncbi:hypothetical protein vseg_009848 [Gypsophila vaccaria]